MSRLQSSIAFAISAGLIGCASPKPATQVDPSQALEKSHWYVATTTPLTFCPKGYSLPSPRWGVTTGEYVYLADRKTRFFMPAGKDNVKYRNEALAVREASLGAGEKLNRPTDATINWVSKTLLRLMLTSAFIIGSMNPDGVDSSPLIEKVWSD